MRVLFLLALAFAVVAAVPRNPQRIVGGEITTISQYPTISSLLYSWNLEVYSQACGGTIITTWAIVTAAHCTFGEATYRWRARVGSSWSNNGGIVHNTASIARHPNFSQITLDNDISIIRTATPLEFNDNVWAAPIAGTNYNVADNQVVWAAGWGATSYGGTASDQLRHVQIWTINQAECRARYATAGDGVTDNMLCSGWLDVGGRDQCLGDSGGPLYHNGVLVGIGSWGTGCGDPFFPGVNTRVSRYTTWIQSNA